MKIRRQMVKIDEDKCNGCGLCVPSCAEGALQIIDGKARLVSDVYCDGLGACLGDCPQGAISMEEREAEAYDEEAVKDRLASLGRAEAQPPSQESAGAAAQGCAGSGGGAAASAPSAAAASEPLPCGCPGMAVRRIERPAAATASGAGGTAATASGVDGASATVEPLQSELVNWPVQIKLVPVRAPYLDKARLLIAADCVPFAFADFHRTFVKGRVVLIGCPKLDDGQLYIDKMAELFGANEIVDIVVPYMEVPCCHGLVAIVQQALEKSGRKIPTTVTKIGLDGEVRETRQI